MRRWIVLLALLCGCAPSQDAQLALAPTNTRTTVAAPNNAALYVSMRSNWYPVVNESTAKLYGRYGWRILPFTPINDNNRTDLESLLVKHSVPGSKNIGYVTAGFTWYTTAPDSGSDRASTYYARWRRLLFANDGVYPGSGAFGPQVRLERPELVDSLADLWLRELNSKRPDGKPRWDGLFLDGFGMDAPVSYQKAGFASQAAYDSAWRVGWVRMMKRLRDGAPKALLFGNSGRPDSIFSRYFSGWMQEGWPYQGGGLPKMLTYASIDSGPNVIFTSYREVSDTTANERRRRKYGAACAWLASTSRGPAIHIHAPAGPNPNPPTDKQWINGQLVGPVLWWKQDIPAEWYAPMGRALGPVIQDGYLRRRHFERGMVVADEAREIGYIWRVIGAQ